METKKAIEIFKSYRNMRSEKVTSSDRMAIQMLFDESQELIKAKRKPIDWTCGGCVSSAFLVVGNYVDYHLKSANDALSKSIKESKGKPNLTVMFETEKAPKTKKKTSKKK